MKVNNCPRCGQSFSTTAAGLELLYSHLLHEHALPPSDADIAVDAAVTEERVDPIPRDLPRYLVASHHGLAAPLAMWMHRIFASPQPAQSSLALLVRPRHSGRAELAGLLSSR